MPSILERLRRALAAQFRVDEEVAVGGMGMVFRGHDLTLDRPVAIKVLRPELATAIGVERFLREARLLARLHHPHIVPVYQGGEADGLLYHVLEWQAGGTLADRLARGPLGPDELRRLADGLLGGLAAAHAAGVVHRDIKPANIFFDDHHVVVADFGIAATDSVEESLTEPGRLLGTRRYMAPEQLRGRPATPATDVYSAARVLLEAAGAPGPDEGRAALGALPRGWAPVLRRGLAEDPSGRWADAAAMRAALLRPRRQRRAPLVFAAAAVVAWLAWPRTAPAPDSFVIAVDRLVAGPEVPTATADSVTTWLLAGLTGLPDIVTRPAGALGARGATMRIAGTVRQRGGALDVALELTRTGVRGRTSVGRRIERGDLLAGVDSLLVGVLQEAWRAYEGGENHPVAALPREPGAMAGLLIADLRYAAGEWAEALATYDRVARQDASCALCLYRIRDLHRWLNRERDTLVLQRLGTMVDRFPAAYGELIEASVLPSGPRLARLQGLREARARFFDLQYLLGDELMHRGPLHGHPRRAAIDPLEEARRLRPEFTGVLEHLLWARTAEGDSLEAARLRAVLEEEHPPRDRYTLALRTLHELGFVWRFRPVQEAMATTRAILATPQIQGAEELPAGPRVLPAFGAPIGAVRFGGLLTERQDQPRLVNAGLAAQAFGWMALGRPDSALRAARDLGRSDAAPPWRMVAPSMAAFLALTGEAPLDGRVTAEFEALARARQPAGGAVTWPAWWLAMLDPARPLPAARFPPPLEALRRADSLARAGQVAEAVALTDPFGEEQYRLVDPFAGALARLRRGEWLQALGRRDDALSELLWHEHTDVSEIPTDEVQSAEVDWAAATMAIWRRARILEASAPESPELCRHWAEVSRRWSGGAMRFAARADSARAALAANPRCRVPP